MEESKRYSVTFSPEDGFQVVDNETGLVADLAVLEGTWRKPGEHIPGKPDDQSEPEGISVKKYGSLRIRSSGATAYDIWAK